MSDKNQTNAKLDKVVGRALRDETFREKLAANPGPTLKGEGLTDDDLEAVSGGALGAYNLSEVGSLNFNKVFAKGTSLGDLNFSKDLEGIKRT